MPLLGGALQGGSARVPARVQCSRQFGRRLISGGGSGGSGGSGGALAPFLNRASRLPQVHPAPSKAGRKAVQGDAHERKHRPS
jgi:hypothetical protein